MPSVSPEVHIFNYTDSYVVTLSNGFGKIQDGSFKFIHPIDINSYDNFLQDTKAYINKNIPETNPLLPTLNYELERTLDLLETVKIVKPKRQIRSFNILGTIWKQIAGSPDHDDAELIYKTLDQLTSNNNRQMVINTAFSNQLNNITKFINKISNAISKNEMILEETIEILRNKIRLVKEDIINIKYAIQWSNHNIINSIILDKKEMQMAIDKLNEDEIVFSNIEEALEVAKVTIFTNKNNLLYVIKIPLTSKILYKNVIIRPIIKNNSIINLNFNEIFTSENETYALKSNCKTYNKMKICQKNHLLNLNQDNCIKNIIIGKNSSCTVSNSHHVPHIEEITDSIIFLNDVNKTIKTDTINYHLCGTFIIKLNNSTIQIDDQIFKSLEAPNLIPLPAGIQASPSEEKRLNLLSLESLKEMHIQNISRILNLKRRSQISIIAMGFISVCLISLSLMVLKKNKKETITKVIFQPTNIPEIEKEQGEKPAARIHNLPLF